MQELQTPRERVHHRNKRTLRFWLFFFFLLLGIGIFWGGAHIEIWWGTTKPVFSTKDTTTRLNSLQNITGIMLIGPVSKSKYLSYLPTSTKNLAIQIYEFTEKTYKERIKRLANTGSCIHIIVENNKYKQFRNTQKVLSSDFSGEKNISVHSDQWMHVQYTHSKIILWDSGFVLQTANLTNTSFTKNREYFFFSQDSWVLASLHTIFSKDRAGKPIAKKDLHPNLVVCNLNCRVTIEQLFTQAKKSILIQTQYLQDPALEKLLLAASRRGVDVRLLLSDTPDNILVQHRLWTNMVTIQKKPYVHAKMILIDTTTLLLGSMNLSTNSLDNNREIWILLIDENIISSYLHQFTIDWKTYWK